MVIFRLVSLLSLLTLLALPGAADARIHYGPRHYVDKDRAGGEPLVLADAKHHTLIYTSHSGTTHLYRDGLLSDPFPFIDGYTNQVNVWFSKNNGKTWNRVRIGEDKSQGFSDP